MKYLFPLITILFLYTSCVEKEPPLACFNFDSIDSIDGGIQFSNCSVEASSYKWTFNNSTDSQEENPLFISDLNFPINVELIATNEFGNDTLRQTITEENLSLKPTADFTHELLLKEGIPVQFQNNSTNATTFLWDFGNNKRSTSKNPVHKYSEQGIYTVSLTASSAQNKNTISKKVTVIDTILLGEAYISFAPNEYNQKEVHFFAVARNAEQFEWDFGDGETSNEKEPVHTYSEYKEYTISLKVFTEAEEKSTTTTIKILDPQYIVTACFEWEIDSINPFTVHFTNFSENATHYKWNFYDQGESTEENPSFTFIEEGELFALVTLYASNENGGYDQVFHCIPEECQLVGKPNIYLYPESIIQLQLSISFPQGGRIEKSVPEYGNGWHVIIEPDGLIDRQHDYLFYESTQPNNFQNEEGWNIAQVNLLEFFEKNMALYKFNEKEIHDFTKYWIPRLINSAYFNIYPQCNKILDEVIALNFSIEPDNIMRLVYLIEPVSQKMDLPTPTIPRFSRNGFDVMEWGVSY